ncbi:MAG TPA: hypothetical protein VKW06_08795 [Candidatus Angelobacter sp.]|nr:hypothetical protein [Candidatus Angelobacter sp.]
MQKAPLVFFGITALAMCCFAFQAPVVKTFSFVPLPETKVEAASPVFTGEISDGQCAAPGSHDAVMKKFSVNSPANCVRGCAKKYGLVLVDASSKTIYKLDNQTKALDFAGQKVKITGPLDKPANTIHVAAIEVAK